MKSEQIFLQTLFKVIWEHGNRKDATDIVCQDSTGQYYIRNDGDTFRLYPKGVQKNDEQGV